MCASLFSDGPSDPRSSLGKKDLTERIGKMKLFQQSREACWEFSSKLLEIFPQEVLDMIYYELLKSCQGVDEDGKFDIVLKPKIPTKKGHCQTVAILKPCYEKLYGTDAVTWPLSHKDLRGKYSFLQDGYMPPIMQRHIILTLLDRGTLWLPDIESLEVESLTSRIFEGLGSHVRVNPYERICQITVPWTLNSISTPDCYFSRYCLPYQQVDRDLKKVLEYNFKKGLKIKVFVDQYFMVGRMPPTQGTVQLLKADGLHIQWELQRQAVTGRVREEGEDRADIQYAVLL